MLTISVGKTQKSTEKNRSYRERNFSVPDYVGETSHKFSLQGISLLLLVT